MTIKIRDKEYNLKYTLRAMILFEQLKGSVFELKTTTDNTIFFYCILLANNKEFGMTYDEFLTELDEDMTLFSKYLEFINDVLTQQAQFKKDEDADDKKKFSARKKSTQP